ncbi:MAG: hypothetical protein E7L00_02160 [Propionibacteriaceae bacterium]|nr:hypothetical protein [Propionibacteriaceae bacterium]
MLVSLADYESLRETAYLLRSPPTLGGCSTQSRTSKGLEPQRHDLIED